MDETKRVPKDHVESQTSSNGALKRYQEKLTDKYLSVVGTLRDKSMDISIECQNQLKQRMDQYKGEEEQIINEQKQILESMGTTTESFEQLQTHLAELAARYKEIGKELREDSMNIYKDSFNSLQPLVTQSYEDCSSYMNQVPLQYADRLSREVTNLNTNYLKTKQILIKTYFTIEKGIIKSIQSTNVEFEQRTNEWKNHKFATLVEDAKQKLNPFNPIDLTQYLNEFRTEQSKFTLCFRKCLQSVTLINPPNSFKQEDIDNWWKEVEEILDLHNEFINQYTAKLQNIIDERNNENNTLVSSLETELVELKDETEASNTLAELTPLLKQTQKYNSSIIDKVTRYWQYRRDGARKSFEAIKNFITPIMEKYNKFVDDTKAVETKKEDAKKAIEEASAELLSGLEAELKQKSDEIMLLVDTDKINARVGECKTILSQIEDQYRSDYKKTIDLLEVQPGEVCEIFEGCENAILDSLKLKKTAAIQEFDTNAILMSAHSSRKPTKSSAADKRSMRRSIKGKADPKNAVGTTFTFTLESGAKFEETGALEILPELEEFSEEPETPAAHGKGGKGKPAKPPVKKPPAKGKGAKGKGKDADDDLDGPEFSLQDSLPKTDNGELPIEVYIPIAKELTEWGNTFRKSIVTELSDVFTREMRRAQSAEERQKLADELNERMRTHAPRATSIELNIAQTRTLQIESRKVQLEKHFRHAVVQFNKSVSNLEGLIGRRQAALMKDCLALRSFVEDLTNQRSTSNFPVLSQNMHISDRQFTAEYERVKADLENDINGFSDFTNKANERFIETVIHNDSSASQEEKDMSSEYFGRMKTQVEAVINQLHEKANSALGEVDSLHNEILEEFDTLLPIHKADVAFSESLNAARSEAKSKYETLMFRNKQREAEIDHQIEQVSAAQSEKGEPQAILTKQLEQLDTLRILLVKRGNYLSLTKSELSTDPMSFPINFVDDTVQVEVKVSEPSAADKKRARPRSKRSESRSKDRGGAADKSRSGKVSTPEEKSGFDPPTSFKSQLESIGNDYLGAVTRSGTEYYNALKNRKQGILRPNVIPPTLQELTEATSNEWKERTADSAKTIEECSLRFRSQVINAATTARTSLKVVYDCFMEYFVDLVGRSRAEVQMQFDTSLKELSEERVKHKAALNPRLADRNNETAFNNLLEEETNRTSKEAGLISTFNTDIVEVERRIMKTFINQLTNVTSMVLSLFDKFVLIDDLKSGQIANAPRRTMKEMLKEKKRMEASGSAPGGARQKNWNGLPPAMGPLQSIPEPQGTVAGGLSSRSGSRRTKKRRTTNEKDSKEGAPTNESGPVITSLDTALHRGTIVERNRCYDEYEAQLSKRLAEFQIYIQSLTDDTNAFTTHWRKCVSALRPDFAVFETEKV